MICLVNGLLESKNPDGETPLHVAARYNSVQIINLLISECEVNKEAKDRKGKTPLYIAAEHGNLFK